MEKMSFEPTSIMQISETWSIPRASLGSISGSSNGSDKRRKNGGQRSGSDGINEYGSKKGHVNRSFQPGESGSDNGSLAESTTSNNSTLDNERHPKRRHSMPFSTSNSKLDDLKQRFDDCSAAGRTEPKNRPNCANSGSKSLDSTLNNQRKHQQNNLNPKRGSRSSQGSNTSNNSSRSASSGSLLLTVANVENLAKIHKNTQSCVTSKIMDDHLKANLAATNRSSTYTKNITLAQNNMDIDSVQEFKNGRKDSSIIPICEEMESIPYRTKDLDSLSIASSTHFTVVNGMGGSQRQSRSGLCSRGHQITILIITMSIVFMIGIGAAVFLLEMRAREMPK